jgi:hypothetical protein
MGNDLPYFTLFAILGMTGTDRHDQLLSTERGTCKHFYQVQTEMVIHMILLISAFLIVVDNRCMPPGPAIG